MAVQFMLRTQSDDRLSQKNNVPHHKATIDPGEPCTLLKYSDSIGYRDHRSASEELLHQKAQM